ncbi:mCG1051041 [Mus musculus]|nr:mCG1051041 [Mus musculus]
MPERPPSGLQMRNRTQGQNHPDKEDGQVIYSLQDVFRYLLLLVMVFHRGDKKPDQDNYQDGDSVTSLDSDFYNDFARTSQQQSRAT